MATRSLKSAIGKVQRQIDKKLKLKKKKSEKESDKKKLAALRKKLGSL